MKKALLVICVIAFADANAQSTIERELPGTWSVIDIGRLRIPTASADPSKVEEMKDVIRSMTFEFRDDHHFTLNSSNSEMTIDDGYWEVKGNTIAVGRWADQNTRGNLMVVNAQQRDGKWFFIIGDVGEVEVSKD